MAFKEMNTVYSEDQLELTNILPARNGKLFNVKAGGEYDYHTISH
jgi:hypothetical protein